MNDGRSSDSPGAGDTICGLEMAARAVGRFLGSTTDRLLPNPCSYSANITEGRGKRERQLTHPGASSQPPSGATDADPHP